jgi:hypothetical protein
MPKTTVNENNFLVSGEYHVRRSRQITLVEKESVAQFVSDPTNDHLRGGVLAPNP